MLPLETLGAFFVTAIVMGLAPGPDNIFVLTQSALYGFRAGIVTTLGLMTGLFGHTAAVALGVAALFQTSEMAFTVLKCAGAAYLLYLAWLSFRSGASRAWLNSGMSRFRSSPLASSSSSLRWPSSEAFHSLAAGLPNGSTLPSEVRSSSTGSPPASSPHWRSCLSSLPDDKKPRHAGLFFFVALN